MKEENVDGDNNGNDDETSMMNDSIDDKKNIKVGNFQTGELDINDI